jgi:hypothetical protein
VTADADGSLGDIGQAIALVSSVLNQIHSSEPAGEPVWERIAAQSRQDINGLLTGVCTLIYVYMSALQKAYQTCGQDAVAEVIPRVITGLRGIEQVQASAIPTMAALMTTAAMDQSPDQWRPRNGQWLPEDLTAIPATAILLAEEISTDDDPNAAVYLIADAIMAALAKADRHTPVDLRNRPSRCRQEL